MRLYNHGYSTSRKEEINPEQVELATRAIREMGFEPIKSINKGYSSYILKHLCERHLRVTAKYEGEAYIGNGALIRAMQLEGFEEKIYPPNAYFNVSSIALNKASQAQR